MIAPLHDSPMKQLRGFALEKHRHIVQARLVQNVKDRPHIILEHVSGPEDMEADLRSWIDHKRLRRVTKSVEFALHIALGMRHATVTASTGIGTS